MRMPWEHTYLSGGNVVVIISPQIDSDKNDTFIKLGTEIQGAVLIRKTVLPGMAIPMLKIRRPNGRLIFNMEIAIRR